MQRLASWLNKYCLECKIRPEWPQLYSRERDVHTYCLQLCSNPKHFWQG